MGVSALRFGSSPWEQELEPRWHDHQVGYASPQGGLTDEEARQFIGQSFGEARTIVGNIGRILSKESNERAFGVLGEPGDPELIRNLAQRVIDVYGGLLEWSSRLRGTGVPEEYEELLAICASFVDRPIQEMRDFVDLVVRETDRFPARLRADEIIKLTLTLTVSSDEKVMERFYAELRRLEHHYGIDHG